MRYHRSLLGVHFLRIPISESSVDAFESLYLTDLAFFHTVHCHQGSGGQCSWQRNANPVHSLCLRVCLHNIPVQLSQSEFVQGIWSEKSLPIVNLSSSLLLRVPLLSIFCGWGKYQGLPHFWWFSPRCLENRPLGNCSLDGPCRLCGLRRWSGKSSSKIFSWSLPRNMDYVT